MTKQQSIYFRLSFIPALSIAAMAILGLPHFMEMYRAFEAPIGQSTRFLFQWRLLFAILPFSFIAVWYFWPRQAQRGTAALAASLVISAVIFSFGARAAYLPLMTLGAN
jgi:hypothetical protein